MFCLSLFWIDIFVSSLYLLVVTCYVSTYLPFYVSLQQELLLAGADPNAVDDEGESVLHRAVAKKYTDCAKVILENGGCKSMAILNSKNLT